MNGILTGVFKILDMSADNGLANESSVSSMTAFQKLFYKQVKEKLDIDAVYFLRDENGVAKIPLIYFSVVDKYIPDEIAKLHKLSWNMGEAPLLFVVCPDEIKVFNNYEIPVVDKNGQLDPDAGLIQTIKIVDGLEKQRIDLIKYHRIALETGEYWKNTEKRFDTKNRVDITLMNNLKVMRKTLIAQIKKRLGFDDKTIKMVVHGLLCRSILIKYLEERTDKSGKAVFPENFFEQFYKGAQKYTDILQNKDSTYQLFDCLKTKFNGDMLQLSQEELMIVEQEDLTCLRDFLLGEYEMVSGQMSLWRLYSFDVIPIQLISSIYELFFHLSDQEDEKGTYYTPLHLVEIMLDEIYPWEGNDSQVSFFDPSCGSGIFLVEAYRRRVCRWMNSHNADHIECKELVKLLTESIFGVDINEDAVRIASFSLSLAMCDFLDPRSIWDQLSFPQLIDKNIAICDFFDPVAGFNKEKFDYIIGNPPWQSSITPLTKNYLKERKKIIGDKQIAQAFSIKCTELCKLKGLICLLMPSKGLLFNRSQTSAMYREDLFKENTVMAIINLSIYRKRLFDHACGPAAIIIYSPQQNDQRQSVIYCTPKPRFTLEDDKKFSIDPTDICHIPLHTIGNDYIWKIAMWGSPRDLELIEKMQNTYKKMSDFIEEHQMISAEGYKLGNKTHRCYDFINFPVVDARNFPTEYVPKEYLPKMQFSQFECMVSSKREIFYSPHLLIKQSHRDSEFLSIVLDFDAVFNHSILGIHGNIAYLKYLSLIIGSRVFSYYHILTNRKWLIERDELEAGDIWATPIPEPSIEELNEAVIIYDSIQSNMANKGNAERYVRNIYHLYDYEEHQVDDVIEYTFDYYQRKGKSSSFYTPKYEDFAQYYKTLISILANTIDYNGVLGGIIHMGSSPLSVLEISLDATTNDLAQENDSEELDTLLKELDNDLQEDRKNIYVRRNIKIYEKNKIYIVKPMQKKFWTFSAACRDADDIFADIVSSSED